jgi:hypothetical protein
VAFASFGEFAFRSCIFADAFLTGLFASYSHKKAPYNFFDAKSKHSAARNHQERQRVIPETPSPADVSVMK